MAGEVVAHTPTSRQGDPPVRRSVALPAHPRTALSKILGAGHDGPPVQPEWGVRLSRHLHPTSLVAILSTAADRACLRCAYDNEGARDALGGDGRRGDRWLLRGDAGA